MTDVFEHNPDDHDDPVAGSTWMVGGLGMILLVVTLLGLTALYYDMKAVEYRKKVLGTEWQEVITLRLQQESLLTGPPRWMERDELGQIVRGLVIPIDRAMEITVEEAGGSIAPDPTALGGD